MTKQTQATFDTARDAYYQALDNAHYAGRDGLFDARSRNAYLAACEALDAPRKAYYAAMDAYNKADRAADRDEMANNNLYAMSNYETPSKPGEKRC